MIIVKSKKEIEGIRKSGRFAAETLNFVSKFIVAGVTTDDLNEIAARYIYDHDGIPACLNYRGFPKAICISVNDVVCHGIPGPYKLKNGDVVKLDITTILNGFFGDTAATFPVGDVGQRAFDLINVTKSCLSLGIQEVKPGAHVGAIGHKIMNYAHLYGYGVVYEYSGHGCGVQFHEEPSIHHVALSPNDGVIMRAGMTFTIEPMINIGRPKVYIDKDGWTARTLDGSLSAQFEHTVLVTEDGYEILTLTSEIV